MNRYTTILVVLAIFSGCGVAPGTTAKSTPDESATSTVADLQPAPSSSGGHTVGASKDLEDPPPPPPDDDRVPDKVPDPTPDTIPDPPPTSP